jgi:hypothetical protein
MSEGSDDVVERSALDKILREDDGTLTEASQTGLAICGVVLAICGVVGGVVGIFVCWFTEQRFIAALFEHLGYGLIAGLVFGLLAGVIGVVCSYMDA